MEKLLALFAVLLVLATACAEARVDLATVSPRPDLPQRPALALRSWGAGYAVIATTYSRREDAWSIAASRAFESASRGASLATLAVPACESVLDLAADGGKGYALCANVGALSLHRRMENGSWSKEVVPLPVIDSTPWPSLQRLAASPSGVAIASSDALAWKSREAARWQVLRFTEPNELGRGAAPSAVLLTSDALWLGYDHGEWSGSLQRARIGPGGVLAAPEPVIERLNVLGLSAADGGGVWVAGGLAHLTGREAVLLRVRGTGIEAVVAQDNLSGGWLPAGTPTPTQRLPADSYFSAYTTSPAGWPLVLDPERGIYQLEAGSLRLVLEGAFEGLLDAGEILMHWGVQEFLAPPGGGFVLALSSGELVEIAADGHLRRVDIPNGDTSDRVDRRLRPAQAR